LQLNIFSQPSKFTTQRPGKVLELFAGSRSIGTAGEKLGMEVFSSDLIEFDKIDYAVNILDFDVNVVPFIPDVIWASPPCTFFSVASIGKHWNVDHSPKSQEALLGMEIAQKTILIIKHFLSLNENLVFFIENPRGKLRKMPFMQEFTRHTVWYCQYGDDRAKPTDIWTNSTNWIPRLECHNGNANCHHESAPRGSQTGTQGRKGSYDRSKIPSQLCFEILQNTFKQDKMNVLSLFDGMSCGQQALERAGIQVDNYFASEIDKYAIQVTMANYPDTIQLGSVVDIDTSKLPKIDLLIGGSPCQSFSFAGKRKGMSTKDNIEILTLDHYLKLKAEGYEFEGQSYLFWEYVRIMNEVKPTYFFLENVMMGEKWERVISKTLGVNPIEINSALVSAQNRRRLYWTNIGMQPAGLFGDLESIIKMPEDKKLLLKDILQDNPNAKYYVSEKMIAKINRTNNSEKCFNVGDKSLCLAAGYYKQGRDNQYITEQIDEKYYLNDDQIEKVLAKTGVDPNIDEPKILDVYNNVIKQDGKSITLTDPCHNNLRLIEPVREVKQINDSNLKSNGGTQPYQQDRVYDTAGISPALAANKSDLLIKEPIPVDDKYFLSEKMTKNMSIYGNENDSILGHSGSGGQKGLIFNTNAQVGSLCATDYKQPKQIISGTLRTHNDGKGFRSIKNNKGATIPARAREDGSGQNVVSIGNRIRRLTPIECERLQTVPDNYTASVSDTQRYKMLGNGWTIDVISHIFKYLNDAK